MNYILAIDQGGSHTRAAVSDIKGNILSYHCVNGACHSIDGLELSMQMIRKASEFVIKKAGLKLSNIDLIYSGMTGADFQYEYDLLRESIANLNICPNIVVNNDSIIALRGGTLNAYGAIVNAGTGVNCAIISPLGEEFIYQYYAQDDIQGGSALSKKILNTIYNAETFRIPPTNLTELVLKHLGFIDVDSLLMADVENKISRIQRLSIVPLVFDAANRGDKASITLIKQMAKAFAGLVQGGVRKFRMEEVAFEVVISGGIFKGKGSILIDTFTDEVKLVAPNASIVNAIYEPIIGAVLLGIEYIGFEINKETLQNIDNSADNLGLTRNKNLQNPKLNLFKQQL